MNEVIVSDKNKLFVRMETECHHLKVEPDSDEILKVWIKEPTWLQVEQALSTVMNVDAKNQELDFDLNKMYRFMVEEFVEKTEPSLTAIDLLRLNPYVGNQLKDVLPNPFSDILEADTGKET
jgi:hypothetical protein|tara:strand:- start:21191 stop:21556 length:366 start_codon:yes stop_codon:yes gene_type:complete